MEANKAIAEKIVISGVYANFIQCIKHFDGMQTFYRMTTSTFMLGTFAAMGFLFSSENKNLKNEIFISLIIVSVIGIAAILSLWHLDLVFCERLLISNFAEALKLEKKHEWLPQVHSNIFYRVNDIPSRIVYFYIGSCSSLILTTGIILMYLTSDKFDLIRLSIGLTTIIAILILSASLKKKTTKIKELINKL